MRRVYLLLMLFAVCGCNQDTNSSVYSLSESWCADPAHPGWGIQFAGLIVDEPERGRRCYQGVMLQVPAPQSLQFDKVGRLWVNDQEVELPEPQGKVLVLGPDRTVHSVAWSVEDFHATRRVNKLSSFIASKDWTQKLAPVLWQHRWEKP